MSIYQIKITETLAKTVEEEAEDELSAEEQVGKLAQQQIHFRRWISRELRLNL
jgi:hypothetical protein